MTAPSAEALAAAREIDNLPNHDGDCPGCKSPASIIDRHFAGLREERDRLRDALVSIDHFVGDAVDMKIASGKLPPIGNLLSAIQDSARAALAPAEAGGEVDHG